MLSVSVKHPMMAMNALNIVFFFRGESYVNSSVITEGILERFVTEKAPRTAVVLSSNGSLSLMQVYKTVHNWKQHYIYTLCMTCISMNRVCLDHVKWYYFPIFIV